MPEIRLFGSLRVRARVSSMRVPGSTVHDALEALCDSNPDLHTEIFSGQQLNAYVRITVNGRDVMLGAGLDTLLVEDDSIAVFPPIAGG